MNTLVQIVVRLSTLKLDRARDTKKTAKIYAPFVIKVDVLLSLSIPAITRERQYKVLKIVTYTMYLITVTDIEKPTLEVHRIVFDNHAECVSLATAVNQLRDPISTKKNCRSVQSFYYDLP